MLRIIQLCRLNSNSCAKPTGRLPHCVVFYMEGSRGPSWLFRVKHCGWLLDEDPFACLATLNQGYSGSEVVKLTANTRDDDVS